MIIKILADGLTENITPDNVYQGSNKANSIVVVAPFSANIQMDISFEIEATGEITTPYLMTRLAPISSKLNAWEVDVDKVMTQYYGSVKYQIRCFNGSQLICTGKGRFKVIEGVDTILPPAPEQNVYDLILEKLSQLEGMFINGSLEARALRQYDSAYTYPINVVVAGKVGEEITMFRSVIDNNKGNPLTDANYWERLEYKGELPLLTTRATTISGDLVIFVVESNTPIKDNCYCRITLNFPQEMKITDKMVITFNGKRLRILTPYNKEEYGKPFRHPTYEDLEQADVSEYGFAGGYVTFNAMLLGEYLKVDIDDLSSVKANIDNIDYKLDNFNFGDLKNIPQASESIEGVISVANENETSVGEIDNKAITPKKLKNELAKLGTILRYKGEVETYADLPTVDNKVGDVWFVKSESVGYAWISTLQWEQIGLNVDLEQYVKKITERDMVYATDKFGNQISKQYNIEPYGDGIAERTSDGRLKATAPKENNDLVNKETLDNLIKNIKTVTELDVLEITNVTYANGIATLIGDVSINDTTVVPMSFQIPITNSDGGLIIDANELNNAIDIRFMNEVDLNKGVPPTATQGTLTEEDLALLQNSDHNVIIFNNEIYTLSSKGHEAGSLIYSCVERENNETFIKTIAITINTRGWQLFSVPVVEGGGGSSSLEIINVELKNETKTTYTNKWSTFEFPNTPVGFQGKNVWGNGDDIIYYSDGTKHYLLNTVAQGNVYGRTWTEITFEDELGNPLLFEGQYVWNYNGVFYLSYTDLQYMFDTNTNSWTKSNWAEDNPYIKGNYIWQSEGRIFCSNGDLQYELHQDLNLWGPVDLGFNVNGPGVWHRGDETYFSGKGNQLQFINGVWQEKQWLGSAPQLGWYIWNLEDKTYFSGPRAQTELIGDEWVTKDWVFVDEHMLSGNNIWRVGNEVLNSNYKLESTETIIGWEPVELAPYTVKKTVNFVTPIENNSILTLLNTDPALFTKYGFALNNPTTNAVDVLAVEAPQDVVNISISKAKGELK